ncbi:helix-turn-helix domain-containing protein [Streptomyces sp. NPDC005529]|uniref:helix-turn-helix domain-containing protein n=1 Tax=Streptomyces sp. NPDC005529 TaxID=3364721 RepID=UPI00368CE0AC
MVLVAKNLQVAADTVRKWRRRFLAERLEGLVDNPRPGRLAVMNVGHAEPHAATGPEPAGGVRPDLKKARKRIAKLAIHQRAAQLLVP